MKTFNYKNTTIRFTDNGKGNAVVLLHGFLEDHTIWSNVSASLSKKFRVLCIDLLGHGKSDCYGYIHTMEDQADMLFALLTELRLRKISLAGHSMGGYIALAFAELYPEHVRSLILLNSSAQADSEERRQNRDRAIEVVKKNSSAFVRMATQNLFSEEAHKRYPEQIAAFTAQAMKTSLQGIIASLEGMKIRMDREVLLHFGPYPKLVIASENDTIIPLKDIQEQLTDTDVPFKIIKGGHVSLIEQQSEVTDAMMSFLKKNG